MNKTIYILLFFAFNSDFSLFSQNINVKSVGEPNTFQQDIEKPNNYPYKEFFKNAYRQFPDVPKGLLEAVSFTMTRIHHIDSTTSESCIGLPRVYGVMGLTLDGKGIFKNNLILVSKLSGFKIEDIINKPEINILAWASAYYSLKKQADINLNDIDQEVSIIKSLCELPDNSQNDFALNSYIYSVLTFLNSTDNAKNFNFPSYQISMIDVFGIENFKLLTSPQVTVTKLKKELIIPPINNNSSVSALQLSLSDYALAIWNPALNCNYTTGRTAVISAITIHDTEGSYSSTISWFQNCSSQVSAHYVVRSLDGQVTQMVAEANKAYHVGSENSYTIGIEHEGYCSQTGWYTNSMYCSSANLVKDICNRTGISPSSAYSGVGCSCSQSSSACLKSTAVKIKGHQMFPTQTHTDPGTNWDWAYYYNLLNGASCNVSVDVPPNDDCSNATTLMSSTSCSNTHGTVTGAANSGVTAGISCFSYSSTPALLDVWYKFQAMSSIESIIVTPDDPGYLTTGLDAIVSLYASSCPGSNTVPILCKDELGTGAINLGIQNLTVGNYYYVRVYSYGARSPQNGGFNICVIHQTAVNTNEIQNLQNLLLYPNPNHGSFSIEFELSELKNIEIKIYNSIGQQIFDKTQSKFIGKYKEQVNLPEISAGVYFVIIGLDGQKISKRILVN